MSAITQFEPELEHIARFQSLQAGQYWRSKKAFLDQGIKEGMVLLIKSIRWVDDAPHTIVLLPHPTIVDRDVSYDESMPDGSTRRRWFRAIEHRFLLKDFLEAFEFEPEHQRVRTEEIRLIQGEVNSLQNELMEAQSNPALLAAVVADELSKDAPDGQGSNLPALQHEHMASMATGTIVSAIGTGITTEGVAALKQAANKEHRIATIKSQWIQSKTTAIGATIAKLTPFYKEQAEAALAQTEDVRTYVAKLLKGIESLDLYVGKDVEVDTIKTGASAPKEVPLTFVQKKLMMDEELAIWADIDEWFDFSNEQKFFDALCNHQALVDQIFPTERCVLVMAITRRYIDYGDSWTNMSRNAENSKVFLLVRDGENIHRVFSPVESHLKTAKLFPSRDDQNEIFRGRDGSNIKFEDVAYTDKLAAHELHALHYKRFLLLVCGLDHRLKLFGDFYEGPPTMNFVSMAFQEKYCRFLHDDDGAGLLPRENRYPSLDRWLEKKNAYLRSGSRLLCAWREVMDPDTAPGACKAYDRDKIDRRYEPSESIGFAIAYRDADSICLDVEVKGYSFSTHKDRTFTCKVNLSKLGKGRWDSGSLPYLCLDAVTPEELHWYIHNREARGNHIYYIRFFKQALKFINAERESEAGSRSQLRKALQEGNIATDSRADEIIDSAVIAWRAANRGKSLPAFTGDSSVPEWKSLLDQMYVLAKDGLARTEEVESFVRGLGYEPLRLVLSGNSKLVVYAAPLENERDDRLTPHTWVHKISLERGKTRMLEKSRKWVVLPKQSASETTLHQWAGAEEWAGAISKFDSYEHKQSLMSFINGWHDLAKPFIGVMSQDEFDVEMEQWIIARDIACKGSRLVENPYAAIPFGVSIINGEPFILMAINYGAHQILSKNAPDEIKRETIHKEFVRKYANKSAANGIFHEKSFRWTVAAFNVEVMKSRCGSFIGPQFGNWFHVEQDNFDYRIETAINAWVSKKDRKVFFADGIYDEKGKFALDDILGIRLPEDYSPTWLRSSNVRAFEGSKAPEYPEYFDIYPNGTDETELNNEYKKRGSGYGITKSSMRFMSHQEAVEYLESKGQTLIPAKELPEIFWPPAGVERWYVME